MAKWENPTREESQLLRERGMDPTGKVVNRIGVDALVFLDLKTREETFVRK